jgi:hypothetical protein
LTKKKAKEALDFIDGTSLSGGTDGSNHRPLFAVIAPPACYSPFTPAPQFARKFSGRRAPRWPSFNRHPGLDKHWLVRQAPQGPLPKEIIDQVDHIFRQRWRTLLSVDQMVVNILEIHFNPFPLKLMSSNQISSVILRSVHASLINSGLLGIRPRPF